MMRKACLGLMWAVACGSGANDRAPAMPAEAGADGGGARAGSTTGGNKTTPVAGSAGDDTMGQGGGEGGAGDGGTDAVLPMGGATEQAPPGVCIPEMKLGDDEAEDIGVGALTLLSMTSDELSVAFTTGSGSDLVLHVADRAATDAELVEASITLPDGFEAASGVTLSSDGRHLILVMSDHSGFGALKRSSRGEAFTGEADPTDFARINAVKPMSGHAAGWPVLSEDGNTLYFVSYFGKSWVVQSERGPDGLFDIGTEIDEFTLGGLSGEYKLLNGLASDQRAIFFFDEATQHSMALFRSAPGAPFYDLVDFGGRRGVTPNAACTRLHSSVDSALVVQARE